MCPSGKNQESRRLSVIDYTLDGFCHSCVTLTLRAEIIIIWIGHDDRRDFSLFFTLFPFFLPTFFSYNSHGRKFTLWKFVLDLRPCFSSSSDFGPAHLFSIFVTECCLEVCVYMQPIKLFLDKSLIAKKSSSYIFHSNHFMIILLNIREIKDFFSDVNMLGQTKCINYIRRGSSMQ